MEVGNRYRMIEVERFSGGTRFILSYSRYAGSCNSRFEGFSDSNLLSMRRGVCSLVLSEGKESKDSKTTTLLVLLLKEPC
jgi:hypothetical protein